MVKICKIPYKKVVYRGKRVTYNVRLANIVPVQRITSLNSQVTERHWNGR